MEEWRQLDLLTGRARRPPPALERATHIAISDLIDLDGTPDWQHTHIASGEYRSKKTAGLLRRMGVRPGWPDFLLISPQQVPHYLELKRGSRGSLSEPQKQFRDWAKRCNGKYAVAKSFAEAKAQLEEWGAIRGRARVSA